MEIFRQIPSGLGGDSLAKQVSEACPPLSHWRKFIYCQTLGGHKYGEVDHFQARHSHPLRFAICVGKMEQSAWLRRHNPTIALGNFTSTDPDI